MVTAKGGNVCDGGGGRKQSGEGGNEGSGDPNTAKRRPVQAGCKGAWRAGGERERGLMAGDREGEGA